MPYRNGREWFRVLLKEMRWVIKFYWRLGKTAPETIKLMKEAYKQINDYRWHDDFRKGKLSAELAHKPVRLESVVNERNVNIMWVILQENRVI